MSSLGRFVLPSLLLAMLLTGSSANAADPTIIVDDEAPTVRVKGAWMSTRLSPGFYGQGYHFRVAGDGRNTFFWPFSGRDADYDVSVRWTDGPNRASDATYTVVHQNGQATAQVNQQVDGGTWVGLGRFRFADGAGHGLLLSDRANGVVVADAVRFTPTDVGAAPSAAAPAPDHQGASGVPPPGLPSGDQARYFSQTGFSISNDRFWDYFHKRGGLRTFGYPISNTFVLLGLKTQMFQRRVMQLQPDGTVTLLNILDEDVLPYAQIDQTRYPPVSPELKAALPLVSEPEYGRQTVEFVRRHAPNEVDGRWVGFFDAFLSSVTCEDAFPEQRCKEELLPLLSLEIWGAPLNAPMRDPANHEFWYLRFQRGVMHYQGMDADGMPVIDGALAADWFKSLLTGWHLPPDLEAQAREQLSPFLRQYCPNKPQWVCRPDDLPSSNLVLAFEPSWRPSPPPVAPRSDQATPYPLNGRLLLVNMQGALFHRHPQDFEENARYADWLGAGAIRVFATDANRQEPWDGQTVGARIADFAPILRKHGLQLIVALVNNHQPVPGEEARSAGWMDGYYQLLLPFYQETWRGRYRTFIRDLIGTVRERDALDVIAAWQLGNELHTQQDPGSFAPFLTAVVEEIRRLDPATPVLPGTMGANHLEPWDPRSPVARWLYCEAPIDAYTLHAYDWVSRERPGDMPIHWDLDYITAEPCPNGRRLPVIVEELGTSRELPGAYTASQERRRLEREIEQLRFVLSYPQVKGVGTWNAVSPHVQDRTYFDNRRGLTSYGPEGLGGGSCYDPTPRRATGTRCELERVLQELPALP